jgi:ferric-dicitrate binding protein FerR (iron transport regulator)
VFRNEPLSLVAGQIGPHAGVTVAVDPAIANRRFSGVLAIGDGSQLVARLGEIMGLAVVPRGAVVHLSAVDSRRVVLRLRLMPRSSRSTSPRPRWMRR